MKTKTNPRIFLKVALGCFIGITALQRTQGDTLIANYPLDEAGGAVAYDASANGWNATNSDAANAYAYRTNSILTTGYGKYFVGANSNQAFIYNIPTGKIFSSYPFTFSGWFRTGAKSNSREFLYVGDPTTSSFYFVLGVNFGQGFLACRTGGNATNIFSTAILADTNNWHHLVGVFASASQRILYVDGVSNGVSTMNMTQTANWPTRIALGALMRNPGGSAADFYDGCLDDVGIWADALSPQKIALMNALGRWEGISLTNSGIATLLNIFNAQAGNASVGFHTYAYATGLGSGTVGATGGSVGAGNAYVVLGTDGSGIQMQGIAGPPSIASFTINPSAVYFGQTATLSWNVANAMSVTIDQGIGPVAATGSTVVTPTNAATTYTLTATNLSGTTTGQVTLTLNTNLIMTFTTKVPLIYAGEPTTLTWSLKNATNAAIDQGIGLVTASGSVNVSPATTTTYNLVATNFATGVVGTNSLTITVLPLPAPAQPVIHYGLDEMTGTNVYNSGNPSLYPGVFQDTISANPVWTSDQFGGGALTFSTTNAANENTAVRAPAAGSITNYPFIMTAWINASDQGLAVGQANTVLSLMNSNYTDETWNLLVYNDGNPNRLAFGARTHGGNNYLTPFDSGGDFSQYGWMHVICVFESPYVRLMYVNGGLAVSDVGNVVPFDAPNRFSLGDLDRTPPTGFYRGSLDDVTVLSGRWVAADVQSVYGMIASWGVSAADAASLLAAFQNQTPGYAFAANEPWQRVSGLSGPAGTVAGNIATGDASIVLDGAGNGMQLAAGTIPIIAVPPVSQTNYYGSTATFSVTAYSSNPQTFQWYFDNGLMPGETNRTLVLADVQPAQAGSYYCAISNVIGPTNSPAATLTVITNPGILSFREDHSSIFYGDSTPVTLSWSVTNATSVWLNPDLGMTSSVGTLTVSPTNTSTWTLIASNQFNAVTQTLTLTVIVQPAPRFVLRWALDEGTGTNVFNSINPDLYSGAFQDTNTMNPVWGDGYFGDGLIFSPATGNNENPAVRTSLAGAITNYPVILSTWFNANPQNLAVNSANTLMALLNSAYNDESLSVTLFSPNTAGNNYLAIDARVDGANNYLLPYTNLDMSTQGWSQAVCVFESPTVRRLYLNGSLLLTDTNAVPFGSFDRFSIGDLDRTAVTGFYNGSLDEVAVLAGGRWFSNDVAVVYGAMKGLGMNTVEAETLRTAFPNSNNYVYLANKLWQPATGLSGAVGTTGGSVAGNTAYEVMDASGNGVQVALIAPVIAASPQSQTNNAGATVTFNVLAYSSTPLHYQWYFGLNELADQTGASLVLANIQGTNAGSYYCHVSNLNGSTDSAPAQLTVISPLQPNQITQAVILPNGHFKLVADATSGYTYQILSSPALTGPWTVAATLVADGSNQIEFEDTTTPRPAAQFYRTEVVQ